MLDNAACTCIDRANRRPLFPNAVPSRGWNGYPFEAPHSEGMYERPVALTELLTPKNPQGPPYHLMWRPRAPVRADSHATTQDSVRPASQALYLACPGEGDFKGIALLIFLSSFSSYHLYAFQNLISMPIPQFIATPLIHHTFHFQSKSNNEPLMIHRRNFSIIFLR